MPKEPAENNVEGVAVRESPLDEITAEWLDRKTAPKSWLTNTTCRTRRRRLSRAPSLLFTRTVSLSVS